MPVNVGPRCCHVVWVFIMVSQATQGAQACQEPEAPQGTDMLGVDLHIQDVFIFCAEYNGNIRNFHAYAALCHLSLLSLTLH